jgi:cell division protein FtsA
MADYLAAIDLGTTKIVSIVGEKNKRGRFNILAYSEAPSIGIRHGQVENVMKVIGVVKHTLDNIRTISGISEINEVYVGIAGLHIRYIENRTEILRPKYEKIITEDEIKMLESNACKLHINAGEKIIHVIPQAYNIDNSMDEITDPIGRLGYKLAGNFMVIIERGISTRHTELCIERLNLSLKELILEPMASARAILTDDEKEMGVVMVDMGGGTTDLMIYHEHIVRHIAIIPFGGNAITEDIKSGCDITFRDAEKTKIQYGSCVSSMVPDHHIIGILGANGREHREISFKGLACIIEARMVEIIEMILYEIKKYTDNPRKLAAGIVFTGGGSQITHLRELVKLKTGMDVRIGRPVHVSESSPSEIIHPKYSTAVGLVMCGFDNREKESKTVWQPYGEVSEVGNHSDVVKVNEVGNHSDVVKINDIVTGDIKKDVADDRRKQPLKSFLDTISSVLYEKKEEI